MKLIALYKLLRIKPTVAWSVCGFILAVAIAINEFGYSLNWDLLTLTVLVAVMMQSIASHAINDLSDFNVDKATDMKGTNRFKVLVSGLMSETDLFVVAIAALSLSSMIAYYIFTKLGLLIFVFYAIGLYAVCAYSLPPLKLGWRPYSEWTVVFPVLFFYVIAVYYIATGSYSFVAISYGAIFALFNVMWFVVSRAMDYYPDKKAGKNTTAVKHGVSWIFSTYKFYILMPITSLIMFFIWIDFTIYLFLPFWAAMLLIMPYRETSANELSKVRTKGIIISSLSSLVVSIALIISA